MNNYRLPGRYKALIVANLAIGITGLLLRPIYPKSIFIALFVMCTLLAAFTCWVAFQALNRPSTSRSQTGVSVIVFLMIMGISVYGIYLTLRSMLK